MIPWPDSIKHLANVPASMTLPPTFEEILSTLRDSFRALRKRCRIADDGMLLESCVTQYADQAWPDVDTK